MKAEPFRPNISKVNENSINKSLVDRHNQQILQVSHQEINFLNTEINELYQISITIRNVTKNSIKIKIKKPSSPLFTVHLAKQTLLASGLDIKVTVVLDNKENEILKDRIIILSESFELQVPINVYPQVPKLQFEPFLNFGFHKIGSTIEFPWEIVNESESPAQIKLVPFLVEQKANLSLSAEQFTLEGKQKKVITIYLSSKVNGTIEGSVQIQPKTLSYSTLQFVANFCDYNRMICDGEGNELKQVILEPMFGGQVKKVDTFLVNNTPESCEYRITRKKGTNGQENNNLVTPEQIGKDDIEKLVQFNPSQGYLQSYATVAIATTVSAKLQDSDIQLFCNYILGKYQGGNFQKEWSYNIRSYINHQQHFFDMQIKGVSLIPKLSLTPTHISFNDCYLQQKLKKPIKIQNFSSKEVTIQLENSANFSFTPNKIRLQPNTSQIVQICFNPKKVGQLNEICSLAVGSFAFPIKIFGKCLFGSDKHQTENSYCEELLVQNLQKSCLQDQISSIFKGKNQQLLSIQHSKSIIHFDTNLLPQGLNKGEDCVFNENAKRTKILRNKNGKQVKIDVNHMNPNQIIDVYPSIAKNQQQQRIVSRQLSSDQLKNISVGPVVLDIGTIFLRSSKRKTFNICNFNNKPICIKLESNHQSFSQTSDERQILPAESHGGFYINYEALTQGAFKHTLQYILNGNHFFQLMVTGVCIAPVINFSRNQVRFSVTEEDKKFQKTQIIKLENHYQYDTEFEWKLPTNSQFTVEPMSGLVKGNSQATCSILLNYQTLTQGKIQQILKLKLKNGKTIDLRCSGIIPESNCICKISEIKFDQACIGKPYQQKIQIKNLSKVNTIFKMSIPKQYENIIVPSFKSNIIQAEDIAEISFKVYSTKVCIIDSKILIIIRGSKNIELNLKVNFILPLLRVQNQEIDFGLTPIQGNSSEKEVTLINDSFISADIQLRFPHETFLYRLLKLKEIQDPNLIILQTKDLKAYKAICMRINPKSKCAFTLIFSPETTQQYEFYLPLFLPNIQPIQAIQKLCKCRGIKNRLAISQKQINFGKIVIDQIQHFYGKNQILEIFNPQQEPISWWIEESNLSPFKIDKYRGKLQGFQKINIKVYFSAETPGQYKREIQFFIDQADMDISKCYMKLSVLACACYPTLFFDQPYLILPTTRSGLESRASLEIINGGYQNINLKHSISQEHSGIQINVIYPVGSNLGVTKKQIKVQVIARSEKPVSFTFKINFHDNSNRTFSINVSGTFDNHTYTLIQHEKTPNLIEKSCIFLKNYLNNTGHLAQEIYEFPKSLIQNDFEKMSIFLAGYSPIFQKMKGTIKKNLKSFVSFEYISQLIKLLKAEGAFLSHIRPQMLLNYDQYLNHLLIRAEGNQLKYSYFNKKDRTIYDIEQKYSWLVLFYQVFKVFSKVNPGKIKQNSQFWLKFTIRQKILLSWLEKSYQSETGLQSQDKGHLILSKLSNGQMLSALISKYTNIKVLEGYGKGVKGLKQKQRRCKMIVDTLSQIGISNLLRVQDLQRSSQKQMLLVLQNLYTILPSYLQKGEPIIFSCQFGQVITKSVEVTNPSKLPINYMAKIEGSKAYSIDGQSQFTIQSKKTQEIKIKYFSNVNINNSSATLTLTGKPNNKFTPSTFIFLLKSNILGRISEKSIHITTNIYQQLDFTIKVPNTLHSDAQFKIQLQNSQKSVHQSFYLLSNMIKIKKGQTGILNMVFLPMVIESQSALLIFRDQKVGEFQYDLTGIVESNVLCQQALRIPNSIYTNKKYQIQLQIPFRNDLILRARKAAEFLAEKLQKKNYNPKDPKPIINYQKYYPKLSSSEVYSVKLANPNNSISIKTEQIIIKDIEFSDESKREEQKIMLEINMKSSIKQGSFSINLRNSSGSDIRKYKVYLTAMAKPLRYQLQLKSPVNKIIVQPLPLINITNQRNIYHISLISSNQASKNIFSLDKDRQITIQAKEQSSVALSFKPRTQNTFHAFLKMQNMTTGQHIEYNLVGIGEEPQAQTILFEQQVRKEKIYNIKLPFIKNTKCNVVSFNLQTAQYQKSFPITSQCQSFRFKFCPKLSGKYQAKLLIQSEQTLIAYWVNINVKNIIQGQVKLRTVERKQVGCSIILPQGHYQTKCEDHNLKVPKTAFINPENPLLNISYYSSIPEEKEIEVTFLNQLFGQITYIVKIIVQPIPEIKLEPFIIELGKIHKEKIYFQNTDDCLIRVMANSTHPTIFYSDFQYIQVLPRSKVQAYIYYRASSLQIQEGKIYFTSNKNAKWTYHLSGYGLAQTKGIIKQFSVNVGEQICQSIIFCNPLNKTLPFHIVLENYDQDNPFSVLLKNYKLDLAYNQELEIPITISPKKVNLYQALLKVMVNEKICWKYDLKAQVGYKSQQEIKTFKILARCKTQQLLEYVLPYSEQYDGEKVQLAIKGANQNIIKVDNGGQAVIKKSKVIFNLQILSYRPKTIQTFMQISKQNGCKWIYKCEFVILPPPIDDKFQIVAAINKPASVKFRLTNSVKSYAKFNAYFTSDSCIDFTVHPKSGQLEPYGREGTAIQVVFCPTQYKKSWLGRLIIQSQESYWSYQVKGCLPHYNPPIGKSHLIH